MPKPCSYCGSPDHYSLMCFNKPRQPLERHSYLRKHGPKAARWREVRWDWIQKHTGPWSCYICGIPLDIEPHDDFKPLTLDHVLPKGTHPELQWDHDNLEPCCWNCNHAKGGIDATSRTSKRDYQHKLEDIQA